VGEISIFATFYILAQIVERALEPVSALPGLCKAEDGSSNPAGRLLNQVICPVAGVSRFFLGDKAKISRNERKIRDYRKKIDELAKKEGTSTDEIDEINERIDDLENEIRSDRARRVFGLWVLASLAGWGLCAKLHIGLVSAVVALTKSAVTSMEAAVPTPQITDGWDFFLTGILVGSGTKPLHDLIARIEKGAAK
jgi:hypothetical protein